MVAFSLCACYDEEKCGAHKPAKNGEFMMNKYIGHPSQLGGIEEVTLAKGKGKGMNLLQIKNTKAIDLTLVCDRCMDMSLIC